MAEATIPVDLRNPGQVFACLGLMEAAEVLLDGPCEGAFDYTGAETATTFTLDAHGEADPVEAVMRFLAGAKVETVSPTDKLNTDGWGVPTAVGPNVIFPFQMPDTLATLPAALIGPWRDQVVALPIEHWGDSERTGRDNCKFWGGAQGKPGAAFVLDAINAVKNQLTAEPGQVIRDPFAIVSPIGSSLRLDWRASYVPLEAGFSPNAHKGKRSHTSVVGYPLVELLAAIGLQNARPARSDRRDKLAYRFGVSNRRLPTIFARAVLGGEGLGFPVRLFRMRLGWPGQEGQARCIIDAQEEFE